MLYFCRTEAKLWTLGSYGFSGCPSTLKDTHQAQFLRTGLSRMYCPEMLQSEVWLLGRGSRPHPQHSPLKPRHSTHLARSNEQEENIKHKAILQPPRFWKALGLFALTPTWGSPGLQQGPQVPVSRRPPWRTPYSLHLASSLPSPWVLDPRGHPGALRPIWQWCQPSHVTFGSLTPLALRVLDLPRVLRGRWLPTPYSLQTLLGLTVSCFLPLRWRSPCR